MKFILNQMHRRGVGTFAPIEIVCEKTGNIKPYECSHNEEWRLTAMLAVKFWANRAQLDEARKIALEAVMLGFHEDTLRLLPQLKLAISDGSKERAFKLVDRIESIMREIPS